MRANNSIINRSWKMQPQMLSKFNDQPTSKHCQGLPGSGIDSSQRDDGGRSAFGVSIVFFCQMLVATALWRRLHVVYQQWPWRLAALQDNRLTSTEKTQICEDFCRASDCCLDRGFAKPLQSILGEPVDLLDKFDAVTKSITVTKVVNSQIENNFARACSAAKCARGVSVLTPARVIQ